MVPKYETGQTAYVCDDPDIYMIIDVYEDFNNETGEPAICYDLDNGRGSGYEGVLEEQLTPA